MDAHVDEWPAYSSSAMSRVQALVETGHVFDYSGSPPVTDLEERFSRLHGGSFAVSFNSGTSALFACLAALGVSAGDEVVVANWTFLASASPVIWLGAELVLADSDAYEPSVGIESVRAALSPRTRAVVATHLFGNPIDAVQLASLCRSLRVPLVEDCSHAHASSIGTDHVGTFGDAAIYSIGSTKMVSGGHGGVLVTRSSRLRDVALLLGHFKPRTRKDIITPELRRYAEFALGGNLRLSPLAAVLAIDHLDRLSELSEARRENASVLDEALFGVLVPVRSPSPRMNGTHFDLVYALPDEVPTASRDQLVTRLRALGVPVSPPSTRPLNRVLRGCRGSASASLGNPMLASVAAMAAHAPTDSEMPHSTSQHDRAISFPARRLHAQGAPEALRLAGLMEPLMKSLRR